MRRGNYVFRRHNWLKRKISAFIVMSCHVVSSFRKVTLPTSAWTKNCLHLKETQPYFLEHSTSMGWNSLHLESKFFFLRDRKLGISHRYKEANLASTKSITNLLARTTTQIVLKALLGFKDMKPQCWGSISCLLRGYQFCRSLLYLALCVRGRICVKLHEK